VLIGIDTSAARMPRRYARPAAAHDRPLHRTPSCEPGTGHFW
jgi:hypothetical protein